MEAASREVVRQGHESDSRGWPTTRFASNTTYDRFVVGPGLDGWIYTYVETEGARAGGLATGLELGVHLSGDWLQRSTNSATRRYCGGSVHAISPGESYDLAFSTGPTRGVLVGFHAYPAQLFGVDAPDAELVLDPCAGGSSALFDMACAIHRARELGEAVPSGAAAIVREHIASHADLSTRDGIWRAKKEIDRHVASDLYLDHLAEAAALHRRTFLRHFFRRFGTSPIQYRIKQRLNAAARLTWAEPELTVSEIAGRCGFDNLAYFHRAFRREFGTTPATYARRAA